VDGFFHCDARTGFCWRCSGLIREKTTKGLDMFKSKNNMTEVPSKGFKRSLLAVSIMALGMPAFAQTAQTENLEEVVVTGMRTSINNAQEIKRAADTVKDVITAADIGAFFQ
jgi:iron complex outermembrane receptor protein